MTFQTYQSQPRVTYLAESASADHVQEVEVVLRQMRILVRLS